MYSEKYQGSEKQAINGQCLVQEQDIMSNTLHFEWIFNSNLSWGFKYFKDSKLLTFLNKKREKDICTVLDQCTNLE